MCAPPEPPEDQRVTTNIERPHLDFMVRQLLPWHANFGRRQVKAPKIYVHDSGLLYAAYFRATHAGAELDLAAHEAKPALRRRGQVPGRPASYAFHAHRPGGPASAPPAVLHPGDQRYPLDRHITVVPLAHLAADPRVITPTMRGRRS
jgi:hypothetical protein